MKKQNLRNNKGITLIALIITIVVLLILAVVAIGAAQESNIVGYAQNAAGKYEEGKGIENNTISGYENILSQYANGVVHGGNNNGGNSEGSNTPVGNLGKYVKYDSNGDGSVADETILWRVLRDDSDKVELITADVLGNVDLAPTDFNDARNKYNGAISAMVAECVRVTGINGVRNVGGSATDTTEIVDFEEIARTTIFSPTVDISEFNKYEGENGLKVGDDTYYLEDWNQMQRAGVAQADNTQSYYLASRCVEKLSDVVFYVRYYNSLMSVCSSTNLCYVSRDAYSNYYNVNLPSVGVRPVLTLDGGILEGKTGEGTKNQPIEIY